MNLQSEGFQLASCVRDWTDVCDQARQVYLNSTIQTLGKKKIKIAFEVHLKTSQDTKH